LPTALLSSNRCRTSIFGDAPISILGLHNIRDVRSAASDPPKFRPVSPVVHGLDGIENGVQQFGGTKTGARQSASS
jgi:hypothetical protein